MTGPGFEAVLVTLTGQVDRDSAGGVGDPLARCDPTKRDRPTPTYGRAADFAPVPHSYELVGEEYGSLAEGGDYEVYRCRVCGRTAYSPMAD